MQQPQPQTPSTPVEIRIPQSNGPIPLDAELLTLVSGAGPNGGWASICGPNGGWY